MQGPGRFVGGVLQLAVVHGVVVEGGLGVPVALGGAEVGVAGGDLDFEERRFEEEEGGTTSFFQDKERLRCLLSLLFPAYMVYNATTSR